MQLIANGVLTHYETLGSGPTLIFLHGWGCDWQIWYPVIQSLSEQYQLIIPDLPAFGQTADPTTTWTSNDYSVWLGEFIGSVVAKKPYVIIGHSFGGKVALKYVTSLRKTAAGKNCAGLVLVDSAGLPPKLTTRQHLLQAVSGIVSPFLKAVLPPSTLQRLLTKLHLATDYFGSTPKQRDILRATIRETVHAELAHVAVPTLLLWGEHDDDTPPSAAHLMAKEIPNAQLQIIPQAGHFPFIDQTTTFLAHLRSFLATTL